MSKENLEFMAGVYKIKNKEEKINKSEEECTLISEVLERHFTIGRNK